VVGASRARWCNVPRRFAGIFVKVKDTRGRVNHVWHTDSILRGIARTTSSVDDVTFACRVNGDCRDWREKWRWKIIAIRTRLVIHGIIPRNRYAPWEGVCEEDVRRANESLSPYCETSRRPPTITKCQITRGNSRVLSSAHYPVSPFFSPKRDTIKFRPGAWKMARKSCLEFPLISRVYVK